MQAYTGFAQVYDIFMDNVPYDDWTEYLTGLLQEYGVKAGLVLELGCGTGKVTRRLAAKGYDMIGIDLSDEMLELAREKEYGEDPWTEDPEADEFDPDVRKEQLGATKENQLPAAGQAINEADELPEAESGAVQVGRKPILYLQQDMREFELYGTVGAVISICDSMNYITSEEDLIKVFRLVNNYLDPGGIFIFDMNTEYKYKNLLGDATIAENREDCSFIWENYYDEEKRINEYNMTIFVKAEEEENNPEEDHDGSGYIPLFLRFQETHYQKAYSVGQVGELLNGAGLEFIGVYDAFTRSRPDETSERVYFIAREKYQENKKYINTAASQKPPLPIVD